MIDLHELERQDLVRPMLILSGRQVRNTEPVAVGLTLVMLALLLGCYALCAALVFLAEHLIRPYRPDVAEAADLRQSETLP